MKIAIQGCAHGELENIYNTLEYIEKENNIIIDLLICCGDFQATRNLDDLESMAVPPKYRSLCTFYKYYSGEKIAPKLTIFIGGNHEASNHLQELPYGGWVAPNIYYMGHAGVVTVGGIRIAGLSGIFKGWDFARGRFEKPPYNGESLRSCFHIRNIDVFRLKQLTPPIHVMLSHDWPAGITDHGNIQELLKNKPYFREDLENSSLGNRPSAEILDCLKPDYWFAAHLHVKFAALVQHKDDSDQVIKTTKFLALDKCLPKRKFLQILDLEHQPGEEIKLKYDLEWLTILQLTNHLISVKKLNNYMPGPGSNERWIFTPTKDEMDLVLKKFECDLSIPKNFTPTVQAHNSNVPIHVATVGKVRINPQTAEFCDRLCVDDPITLLLSRDGFHEGNSSLNSSNYENSSFITGTDSETDISMSGSNSSVFERSNCIRTPLKLPTPKLKSDNDKMLTSTPLEKVDEKPLERKFVDKSSAEESETSSTPVEKRNTEETTVRPNKFRRRNLELYTSTHDN